MRKVVAVLYENKVFSSVATISSIYRSESILDDPRIQQEGDEYISMDPYHVYNPYTIYCYDKLETHFLEMREKCRKSEKINLPFAKKIIVDDRFPAHAEFWFPRPTREPETLEEEELHVPLYLEYMGDYPLVGGRRDVIHFIRDRRYSEAIPELRDVALHDYSYRLRLDALKALGSFGTQKADPIVNEILGLQTDPHFIMDIAYYISSYSSSEIYIPNLLKKFEECADRYLYLINNDEYRSVLQAILHTASHITALSSLDVLTQGLLYRHDWIKRMATVGMINWAHDVLNSPNCSSKLIKRALAIRKEYGGISPLLLPPMPREPEVVNEPETTECESLPF